MDTRLILNKAGIIRSNGSVVANVELAWEGATIVGEATSIGSTDGHLFLVGEATVRALRELLPPGYGLSLVHMESGLTEMERVAWAKLLLFAPDGPQRLLGIARFTADTPGTAAKAILSAVNRRAAFLLGQPTSPSTPR